MPVLAALGLAAPAQAAPPVLTDSGAVVLGSAPVYAVVPSTGGYRMYFSSNAFQVLSATSADGVSWTVEDGVRLSTETGGLDQSSITAAGFFALSSTGPLRMFYVGKDATQKYAILSATSTDGLTWVKEAGFRLQFGGGAGFIGSLAPANDPGTGALRLYYVRDQAAGDTPSDYRVFSALSGDGGTTLAEEGIRLSTPAYQVAVSSLTDARVRLYYATSLSTSTTAAFILSAISSNGKAFTLEDTVVYSTAADFALGSFAVQRATESWRWRLWPTITATVSTFPYVGTALTLSPTPQGSSPNTAFFTSSAQTFTATGEVFSPAPTVQFRQGTSTLPGSSVTRVDDTKITFTANPNGATQGAWALDVTNSDAVLGTLADALTITFPPGVVTVTDNLFRPLAGGSASIDVTIFDPGHIRANLYTLAGELVKTIADVQAAAGTQTYTWSGDTSKGSTVASGVYLLHVTGPRLDQVQKIVVIK